MVGCGGQTPGKIFVPFGNKGKNFKENIRIILREIRLMRINQKGEVVGNLKW